MLVELKKGKGRLKDFSQTNPKAAWNHPKAAYMRQAAAASDSTPTPSYGVVEIQPSAQPPPPQPLPASPTPCFKGLKWKWKQDFSKQEEKKAEVVVKLEPDAPTEAKPASDGKPGQTNDLNKSPDLVSKPNSRTIENVEGSTKEPSTGCLYPSIPEPSGKSPKAKEYEHQVMLDIAMCSATKHSASSPHEEPRCKEETAKKPSASVPPDAPTARRPSRPADDDFDDALFTPLPTVLSMPKLVASSIKTPVPDGLAKASGAGEGGVRRGDSSVGKLGRKDTDPASTVGKPSSSLKASGALAEANPGPGSERRRSKDDPANKKRQFLAPQAHAKASSASEQAAKRPKHDSSREEQGFKAAAAARGGSECDGDKLRRKSDGPPVWGGAGSGKLRKGSNSAPHARPRTQSRGDLPEASQPTNGVTGKVRKEERMESSSDGGAAPGGSGGGGRGAHARPRTQSRGDLPEASQPTNGVIGKVRKEERMESSSGGGAVPGGSGGGRRGGREKEAEKQPEHSGGSKRGHADVGRAGAPAAPAAVGSSKLILQFDEDECLFARGYDGGGDNAKVSADTRAHTTTTADRDDGSRSVGRVVNCLIEGQHSDTAKSVDLGKLRSFKELWSQLSIIFPPDLLPSKLDSKLIYLDHDEDWLMVAPDDVWPVFAACATTLLISEKS
eukprot:gene5869-6160_t